MNYNSERQALKERAKENIIDVLESGYDGYLCDLHNEVFNNDYEYVYTSDAEEMLMRYGVFEAIEEIKEYELDNFGTVDTDFSSPCAVANMFYYIIGDETLNELMDKDSDFCNELWNSYLEEEDIEKLIEIFERED